MRKLFDSPRIQYLCFFLIGFLQVGAILIAFERPAQAYVDPGSGFVFLQVAGSMVAGALYYLRHRVRRLFSSLRRSPAAPQAEAIENQP